MCLRMLEPADASLPLGLPGREEQPPLLCRIPSDPVTGIQVVGPSHLDLSAGSRQVKFLGRTVPTQNCHMGAVIV